MVQVRLWFGTTLESIPTKLFHYYKCAKAIFLWRLLQFFISNYVGRQTMYSTSNSFYPSLTNGRADIITNMPFISNMLHYLQGRFILVAIFPQTKKLLLDLNLRQRLAVPMIYSLIVLDGCISIGVLTFFQSCTTALSLPQTACSLRVLWTAIMSSPHTFPFICTHKYIPSEPVPQWVVEQKWTPNFISIP